MRINNSILIWALFAVGIFGALLVYKFKFSVCLEDPVAADQKNLLNP